MEEILRFADGITCTRGKELFTKKAKTFYQVLDVSDVAKQTSNLAIMRLLDLAASDDGTHMEEIPGKGRLCATISSMLFGLLKGEYVDGRRTMPLKTHFIAGSKTHNAECLIYYMAEVIPLELIVRNKAYGSCLSRLHLKEGTPFTEPFYEFTEKDDARRDPLISDEEIIAQGIANGQELQHMRAVAVVVNHILSEFFLEIGIELADFKLVFGRQSVIGKGDPTNIRLIGELSPDVFRLRDLKTGECLDKDIFRKGLDGLPEAYAKVSEKMLQSRRLSNQKIAHDGDDPSHYDGYGSDFFKK